MESDKEPRSPHVEGSQASGDEGDGQEKDEEEVYI